MGINYLTELQDDEILFRMKKQDAWRLQDIVLFAHGYEYKEVFWDYIIDENAFPIREYNAALEATNSIDTKTRLDYVRKSETSSGPEIFVKKGTFFPWAVERWDHDPRVGRTYNLWKKYKLSSGKSAPSLQSLEALIKNAGDRAQVKDYIEFCKHNAPKDFKVNKTKLAKRLKKEMTTLPQKTAVSTFRKYLRKMSPEDLEREAILIESSPKN